MILLISTLLVLLLAGAPIGVALAGSSALYAVTVAGMDPIAVGQSFFFQLNSTALLTIPFFILAGFLMEKFGLVKRLFDFAEALLGWIPGGMGIAAVFTCIMFAAMSGSSAAMASAMSLIVIPAMVRRGYPRQMAAGIVAVGGGIGLLIPPSISLIIFGIVTETSIPRLFLAGVIPGLMLGAGMMAVVVISAVVYKLGREPFVAKQALKAFWVALPALGMPAIVLGGLYGGVFTPSEAAAVAVAYAFLVGLFVSKWRVLHDAYEAGRNALNLSTMIFFLLGAVGMFKYVAANEFWPQKAAGAIIDLGLPPLGFLLAFAGLLLILGMFLDGTSMILLTVPVVFPVSIALDISPMHLAVIAVMGVELASVTPPVGFTLFAVSGVANIPIPELLRGAAPYFASDMTIFTILIFVPWFSTYLPSLL